MIVRSLNKIQGMSIKFGKDGVYRSKLKWAQELEFGQSQFVLLDSNCNDYSTVSIWRTV